MLDFLLAYQNLPFTIALGLMIGLLVLELVTLMMGAGASDLLDSALPEIDADIDLSGPAGEFDLGDAASYGPVTKLLGWMHIGRVPMLILLGLFLFAFGMLGLIVQAAASTMLNALLPGWLASIPAFLGAVIVVHHTGRHIARIMPKEESTAVSVDSFIGRIAQITIGTARRGAPAQARLRDKHGQTHYVMVEPDTEDAAFAQGDHGLLVKRQNGLFLAIANPSDVLVDQDPV